METGNEQQSCSSWRQTLQESAWQERKSRQLTICTTSTRPSNWEEQRLHEYFLLLQGTCIVIKCSISNHTYNIHLSHDACRQWSSISDHVHTYHMIHVATYSTCWCGCIGSTYMYLFLIQRFKPLPSIGSQNALVETDSAIDIQSPDFSSSHMTSNIGSHDHYHHTPKQQHTVPPEPCPADSHTVTLCVRLPDGSRSQRRFNHSTHTLQQLLVWAVLTLPSELGVCSPAQVELVSSTVPKVVYRDWSLTLGEAGLTQNTLLCLTIL